MSLFWALIFLSFAFSVNCSESKNQKKLPSAVLVGTVYCDTCFHQDFPKASRAIEGATVAVECKNTRSSPSFRREVETDNHGEFKVNLPFPVSKHVKKIKGCSVKLISSNEPYCAVSATPTSTMLNLKSRKEGVHIFSAGFFTFKPLNQPQICDQKSRIWNFKKQRVEDDKSSMVLNANDPAFLQPVQDPPYNPPVLGHLPPLPLLPRLPPLPQLPQLPPLPGIPYLPPVPAKETAIKSLKLSDEEINQPATSNIPFVPNPFNPPYFLRTLFSRRRLYFLPLFLLRRLRFFRQFFLLLQQLFSLQFYLRRLHHRFLSCRRYLVLLHQLRHHRHLFQSLSLRFPSSQHLGFPECRLLMFQVPLDFAVYRVTICIIKCHFQNLYVKV